MGPKELVFFAKVVGAPRRAVTDTMWLQFGGFKLFQQIVVPQLVFGRAVGCLCLVHVDFIGLPLDFPYPQ